MADLTVRTTAGDLRGTIENGVAVFRGVPYAAPPVGPLRFAAPQPMPAWSGLRDATTDGAIAPQGRSRLAHVMGDFECRQDEDCLTLTLWTPEAKPASNGPGRPVVVWIHGGAFSSGAGSLPWYSGARFAETDDIVAVSLNYRLGALGFLYLPGISGGNLGLLDQVAALRWIRDNIRAFGGDPANVTLVGQSAGGNSIAAMMSMPAARGLFRRAVLQSAAFGRISRPREDAERIGRRLLDVLGLKAGEAERLRSVAPTDFLAAQGELGRLEKKFADAAAPFGLVIDGTVLPGPILPALAGGTPVDVMIGSTREEMAAFYAIDKDVQAADEAAVRQVCAAMFKDRADAFFDEFTRLSAARTGAALLEKLYTDQVFRRGALQLAEYQARCGRPAYVYQFDWRAASALQSCHCIEIPFVFDNLANWPNAPMLAGGDAAEMAGLVRAMHRAWVAFARGGNPNHDRLPRWQPYEPARRVTMRFDSVVGPVDDLAGLGWRQSWPE
jgi:para-nitrobenzyl esterase